MQYMFNGFCIYFTSSFSNKHTITTIIKYVQLLKSIDNHFTFFFLTLTRISIHSMARAVSCAGKEYCSVLEFPTELSSSLRDVKERCYKHGFCHVGIPNPRYRMARKDTILINQLKFTWRAISNELKRFLRSKIVIYFAN